MFTKDDLLQIEQHGLTEAQVECQMENFRQGFPFLKVVRAASAGDGVMALSQEQVASAVQRYEDKSKEKQIVKLFYLLKVLMVYMMQIQSLCRMQRNLMKYPIKKYYKEN